MRLALGCAQFGMKYGISNSSGQTSIEEVGRILQLAKELNITALDTAAVYEQSESVLGCYDLSSWRVTSKIAPLPANIEKVRDWVVGSVRQSISKLHIERLHCCLLHRPKDLLGSHGDDIAAGLMAAKDSDLVSKVGYSVYSPEELDPLMEVLTPDVVQLPFNVFDQRLLEGEYLERLRSIDCEIQVRSVFLQGLLIMEPKARPRYFEKWKARLQDWDDRVEEYGGDALELCLSTVKQVSDASLLVVGIENIDQLRGIWRAWNTPRITHLPDLACSERGLIDPQNWVIE